MSQEPVTSKRDVKSVKEAIELAEKLMKDVHLAKGEERGMVTSSRLRKMLDLASRADLYEEFRVRLLYLVARNTARDVHELENFAQELLREIGQRPVADSEKLGFVRLVLEYAAMGYAAKELGRYE